IAALANYLILLVGLQARQLGHERRFQSNSLRRKRVLSLWRLGLEYGRKHPATMTWRVLEDLERRLRVDAQQQSMTEG
ncbi:MAG: IS4 family transposase, partial [Pseudomonas sp.]